MTSDHLTERDLRLFLVLDRLIEERSVTRTALRLGITQSAVSHSLRILRNRMRDPLLVRTGTSLEPTPFALTLRPSLRLGLAELERVLHHELDFDPATSNRRFSLATPDHPQFTILPELIGEIRKRAPGIDIRIRSLGSGMLDDLASGRLDLVLAGPALEQGLALDQDVKRASVISEPFLCLLRNDHPSLKGDFNLETYLRYPHVLVSPGGDDEGIVDRALATSGHRRRVALTVPSFLAAAWIAASSDLIATLPQSVTDRAAQLDVEIRTPPLSLPKSEAFLWWHPRFQHDPGHVWWRTKLTDALGPFRR